jgi:hypothetical protein
MSPSVQVQKFVVTPIRGDKKGHLVRCFIDRHVETNRCDGENEVSRGGTYQSFHCQITNKIDSPLVIPTKLEMEVLKRKQPYRSLIGVSKDEAMHTRPRVCHGTNTMDRPDGT